MSAGPTVSGSDGSLPISSACRWARRNQPRIICRMKNAINTASTAAMISDATKVGVFMRDSFRPAR